MTTTLMDFEDLLGLPGRVEEFLDEAPARCLAFNPWGTLLAVGCTGGLVAIYDYQTRGLACKLEGGHATNTDISAVLWSRDGTRLLSGAADGSLSVWDVASRAKAGQFQLPRTRNSMISNLAWVDQSLQTQPTAQPNGHAIHERQHDNEVLVSMRCGGAVRLRLSDGYQELLPCLFFDNESKQLCSSGNASLGGQVAVASRGGDIIYAASRGLMLVLRSSDLATLDSIRVDSAPEVLALEVTSDGRRLLLTTADQQIRMYLVQRPGDRQPTREQERRARSMGGLQAFWAAQAAMQSAVSLQEWPACRLEDAQQAWAARQHPNSLFYDDTQSWLTLQYEFKLTEPSRSTWRCTALSPDGEYFASAHDGLGHDVYLWDAASEARNISVLEAQAPRDSRVEALCWHPKPTPMQLLAVNTSGSVYIWTKAFTENWSSFAPDFAELQHNDEYVEPEDEFDNNPRPQDHSQQQAGDGNEREEADVEVDIGHPQEQQQIERTMLGLVPDGHLPLLHLPLHLDRSSLAEPDGAAPAADVA